MLGKIKQKLAPYYTNLFGWRTDRKIVVIESDDWGSIRMPSREVYEKCLKAGYPVDKNPYERYDSLASEDDLEHLFSLLSSFKDIKGNNPVITANILPANPDFEKIKRTGYEEYIYELVPETLARYPRHSKSFQLWKEGLANMIFFPQSHGREHLNVSLFMDELQNGNKDLLFSFNHGVLGGLPRDEKNGSNRYVEALRYSSKKDKIDKLNISLEGLRLFESLMKYKSRSFMPQNYLWSPDFDDQFFKNGVQFYQGNRKMKEPVINGKTKFHSHWTGNRNDHNQLYLVRNVMFEPSLFRKNIDDPVNMCMKEISIAFKMNKPAIISSHRVNYIGFIDEKNRDQNLKLLQELISGILMRWPEAEFMNSCQLGELISETDKHSY